MRQGYPRTDGRCKAPTASRGMLRIAPPGVQRVGNVARDSEASRGQESAADKENLGDVVVQRRHACQRLLAKIGLFPVLPAATDTAVTWDRCVMTSSSERQRRDGWGIRLVHAVSRSRVEHEQSGLGKCKGTSSGNVGPIPQDYLRYVERASYTVTRQNRTALRRRRPAIRPSRAVLTGSGADYASCSTRAGDRQAASRRGESRGHRGQ